MTREAPLRLSDGVALCMATLRDRKSWPSSRIAVGLLFFCHGAQKVFGLFSGIGGAPVPLVSLFGVAGALEFERLEPDFKTGPSKIRDPVCCPNSKDVKV